MSRAFDQLLDASGEVCPKPVLLARQALKKLPEGNVLKIISTDSQSRQDFEIFCRLKNLVLVQGEQAREGTYIFYITKQ